MAPWRVFKKLLAFFVIIVAMTARQRTRKIFITIVGFTVLLIGLALLVLPGPGIPLLIIGLGLLAAEYEWAQRHLDKANHHYQTQKQRILDSYNGRRKKTDQ